MSDNINLVYSTPAVEGLPKTTWIDKDEEIKRLEAENENTNKFIEGLRGLYNKVVSLMIKKEERIKKQQKFINKFIEATEESIEAANKLINTQNKIIKNHEIIIEKQAKILKLLVIEMARYGCPNFRGIKCQNNIGVDWCDKKNIVKHVYDCWISWAESRIDKS